MSKVGRWPKFVFYRFGLSVTAACYCRIKMEDLVVLQYMEKYMKKQFSTSVFRSLTFGCFIFGYASVHASDSADAKVYPAFMCLESGKETGDFNRSLYRVTRLNGAEVEYCCAPSFAIKSVQAVSAETLRIAAC